MPVSLLTEVGKLYLIAGDNNPLNKELAPLAAKTVTLRGKVASRDGMHRKRTKNARQFANLAETLLRRRPKISKLWNAASTGSACLGDHTAVAE